MAPLSELETEVYLILQKYAVRLHYRASGSGARYAVFKNGVQVSQPKPHAEARADRDRLTAQEIATLLQRIEAAA